MPTSPEQAVKKLSRLPSNCVCPNCGTYSKYGFSTICIKYLTFVCNACKSSHQAISHRCKSLTMSSWDQGEILKLRTHGNDYARAVWLANAPEVGKGGRPKEGDDINLFKRFIVEVYEQKRYYQEPASDIGNGGTVAQPQHTATATTQYANQHPVSHNNRAPPARRQPPSQTPAPAPPAVDLLDFGAAFDSALPTTTASAPLAAPVNNNNSNAYNSTPATQSSTQDLFDPFNTTGSANATQPVAAATTNNNSATTNNDPFASSMQSNNVISSSNNAFVATSSTSATAMGGATTTANDASFDPFGTFGSSSSSTAAAAPATMQQKTPVMNTSVMNNSSSGSMMMNNTGGGMMNQSTNMMNNSNKMMMMNGSGNMNGSANNMMNGGGNMMMANTNPNMMMNNSGMMNGGNDMMMNNSGMMNGGMMNGSHQSGNQYQYQQQQVQQPQQRPPAMNMNIMQPMNNSISNSFGSSAANSGGGVARGDSKASSQSQPNAKSDPFAGLGF